MPGTAHCFSLSSKMKLDSMVPFRAIWLGVAMLETFARAQGDGLSQQYCSSENTGSDYDAVYNIYQSNGACSTQCSNQNYAFGIVQYQNCWCSNYIPAEQQSTSDCNQSCPGYPDDKCGNADEGLYGYIALKQQPSGTAGAASTTQTSSTPASSTTSQAISTSTSSPLATSTTSSTQSSTTSQTSISLPTTSSAQPTTDYTPSSSSSYSAPSTTTTTTSYSSPSTTSTSASTSSSSSAIAVVAPIPATTEASSSSGPPSATPSPVTSVQVVTISGAIVTQTVTSTPVVTPSANPDTAPPLQRKGLSGGAIAGAVIGSLLGVAALLFGAFLLWRRKRQNDDESGTGSFHGPHSPRRNVSVLSKTGLLNRGRPASVTEKDYEDPLYVNTHTGNNSVRHSMLLGAGAAGEGVSPVSLLGSAHDGSESRRHSRPMVYDQRLNPSALFANANANGSRVSMQDQQDYSRPLGIINPDVRPSFESRNS